MSGRRLKRRLLNRYCIIGRSESVTRQAGLSQSRGRQKRSTWTGLIMTRYYIRLGGIPKGGFLALAGLRKVFDICGKFSYSSGKFQFSHVCSLGFCTLGDFSNDMPALIMALRMQPISAFILNTTCMSFEKSEVDCFGDRVS